jgi:NADH-quinone oxidoreductase subunit I
VAPVFGSGLAKGLAITMRRLLSGPVTELYPYEHKVPAPASRTFLAMSADAEGNPACRACNTCIVGCPDHALRLVKDPEDPKRPYWFAVNSGRCTFCGLCVENCTYKALHFTQDYERATYDRATLIYYLVHEGRHTGEGEERR